MIATGVASPFLTPFKLTLMVSLFLAIPIILHQIWGFIAPGLYKHEKRIAIPLLIQTYGIFALTYFTGCKLQLPHNVAAPASMIGASNFFELAVAVAISLFGLHSGAALATVVGVLVEVPVMLSLVWFANRTRHWFTERNTTGV
jgi:ACR3 family arsenite efflux pump ArsB